MYEFFNPIEPKMKKLMDACSEGDAKLVEELIKSGVNIDQEYADIPLSQAAFKGHLAVVNILLTQQNSQHSKDLALVLACQAGHEIIVDLLLKNKADVNVYFEDYHTPLFQAITKNRSTVFSKLLQKETIKINAADKSGILPLHLAAFNGRLEMVQQLVKKGADLNLKTKEGWTAKELAEKKKHQNIINYLEEQEHTVLENNSAYNMEAFAKK